MNVRPKVYHKASPTCFALIRSVARFRPTAHRYTPRHPWLIGWDHAEGVKEGDTCDLFKGDALLRMDVSAITNALNEHILVPTSQNQFDALGSLVLGITISGVH
jgi:lysozyme